MPRWQQTSDPDRNKGQTVGLPVRPFLYTLDQIATLINVTVKNLEQTKVHYDRHSVGQRHKDHMLAHNIAAPGEPAQWRVAERELVRWLRYKGFTIREEAWITH